MKNTTKKSGLRRARRWCEMARLVPQLAAAPVASAEESPDFGAMLEGIDVVPTRAQLEETWPDAQARMVLAATEGEGWQRKRAISLLSLFPTPETRVVLQGLLANADAEVRRDAVYTLARAFGRPGDEALVAEVLRVARGDASEAVRQHAVRGLRWVDHAAAAQALLLLAESEGDLSSLAGRVYNRRVKRLRTPRVERRPMPTHPPKAGGH